MSGNINLQETITAHKADRADELEAENKRLKDAPFKYSQKQDKEIKRLRDALEVLSKLDWSRFVSMLATAQYMQRIARDALRKDSTLQGDK